MDYDPIESKCLNFEINKSYTDRIVDNVLSTSELQKKNVGN